MLLFKETVVANSCVLVYSESVSVPTAAGHPGRDVEAASQTTADRAAGLAGIGQVSHVYEQFV